MSFKIVQKESEAIKTKLENISQDLNICDAKSTNNMGNVVIKDCKKGALQDRKCQEYTTTTSKEV